MDVERRVKAGTYYARPEGDALPEILLGCAIVLLLVGFIQAHTLAQAIPDATIQAATNATLFERQAALSARLDKIETLLQYGMIGLFSNLGAHLFQIIAGRNQRHSR